MLLLGSISSTNVQALTMHPKSLNGNNSRISIIPDKNKDKVLYFTSTPTFQTKEVECAVGGTVTLFDQTSGFIYRVVNIGNEKFKVNYKYKNGIFGLLFDLKEGSDFRPYNLPMISSTYLF